MDFYFLHSISLTDIMKKKLKGVYVACILLVNEMIGSILTFIKVINNLYVQADQ